MVRQATRPRWLDSESALAPRNSAKKRQKRAGLPAPSARHQGEDEPKIDAVLILANAHHEPVAFVLPKLPVDGAWWRLLDTADPAVRRVRHEAGSTFPVPDRGLVMMRFEAS